MNAIEILNQIGTVGDMADARLLARFLDVRDAGSKAALTALVERHGPMVLRVCRQVLGNVQDAEDAFQVTFLVFTRKAHSIRAADSVASWLHGVALRVAKRSKFDTARRRAHELRIAKTVSMEQGIEETQAESWPGLHEEIARLPERYRDAVVLCYLEGLSTEAAALRIGCPRGTVLSRLSRARDRLRDRLNRRGLNVPPAVIAEVGGSTLPSPLIESTVRACLSFVGRWTSEVTLSNSVIALTKEILFAMTISKLKMLSAVVVVLGFTGLGVGVFVHAQGGSPFQKPQAPPASAVEPNAKVVEKNAKPNKTFIVQPNPNKTLAEAQLKLVEKAFADLDRLGKGGEIGRNDTQFALWDRRLLEASRAAGASKEKLVTILENHLHRARQRVRDAALLYKAGAITQVEMFDAEYSALEAEMWLNEEKAR